MFSFIRSLIRSINNELESMDEYTRAAVLEFINDSTL